MSAGRSFTHHVQSWGTPSHYVQSVRDVFGADIDLDPCSNEWSVVSALTEYRLPDKDGLRESWEFRYIYVNPPYGRDPERGTSIRDWLRRCRLAYGNGSEILALVPVATNTRHWKESVWGQASMVCFLYDTRLRFLEFGTPSKSGAPMACAMIYWGRNSDRFRDVFKVHGAVVSTG